MFAEIGEEASDFDSRMTILLVKDRNTCRVPTQI